MDRTKFLATFGSVFEHSEWVAEAVYDSGDMSSDSSAMAECFESVFLASDPALQLATLRAHPQLASALAVSHAMTTDSVSEQTGAGLDQCSETEFAEFKQLNADYINRFGFPFIIAVKGRSRHEILGVFGERLENTRQVELQAALHEVCRIARFRIEDIVDA